MSRRALASSLASRFKLVELLERFGSRPGLIVLVYHRVARPEDCIYDRAVIEATPEQFDEQMSMLRRRHTVVGPDELRDLIDRPRAMKHLHVALTFDDGYQDNYSVAFPILRSHGLRALFFVTTRFVGSHELTWWDRIAYAVRHTRRSEIALELPVPIRVRIDPNDRETAIEIVLRAYKTGRETNDEAGFLRMLEKACDVQLPERTEERQFFSWDEAEEMARAGMGIGSHTYSHRILGGLPRDEQLSECERSFGALKDRSFGAADCLAYPVGSRLAFSAETKELAHAAGYRYAFSNYGGLNTPDDLDPLDIRRIGMAVTETATQLRLRLAASAATRRQVW